MDNGYGDIEIQFRKPSNPLLLSSVVLIILGIIGALLLVKIISYTLTRLSDNTRIEQQEITKQSLLEKVTEANANGILSDEEYKEFLEWFKSEPEDPEEDGKGGFLDNLTPIMWAMVAVAAISAFNKK